LFKKLFLIFIILLWTFPAYGFEPRELKYNVGGFLGYHIFDDYQDLYKGANPRNFHDTPGNMAIMGGYFGTQLKNFNLETVIGVIPATYTESDSFSPILQLGIHLMYRFENTLPVVTPYVKLESGFLMVFSDEIGTDMDAYAGPGVGIIHYFTKQLHMRLEADYFITDAVEVKFANNFQFRLMAGYTFGGSNDYDGDGILNKVDKCIYKPEDKDGFQDVDGCPEPDNDSDGIKDKEDKCPGTMQDLHNNFKNTKEDMDGFKDLDGCPDRDNDKDGILDDDDKCPGKDVDIKNNFKNTKEDKDGFKDLDGCPEPDNDKDGVLDINDKCPGEEADISSKFKKTKEDIDGYKDKDGCPDLDNDTDGILDIKDKCPGKDFDIKNNFKKTKETINGFKDDDGCPDSGKKPKAVIVKKKIKITRKIFFNLNESTIKPKSYSLLRQVALTIKANPQLLLVEVQGHAGTMGEEEFNVTLSRERAKAVRRYLISRGVKASRLVAKKYGYTMPLKHCSTSLKRYKRIRCEKRNRRVEFVILKTK
jgi:outer membrane protein OmpA-like peptidoglycan-associated protein